MHALKLHSLHHSQLLRYTYESTTIRKALARALRRYLARRIKPRIVGVGSGRGFIHEVVQALNPNPKLCVSRCMSVHTSVFKVNCLYYA
jgi:DNA-binding transcriptional regulator LsrR (DeoR family)